MSDKYCTFIKKYVIMLLLCTISFMVLSQTITIINPDGTVTLCEVDQSGNIICF